MTLHQDIPLAQYTTIGLGGNARYFITCTTSDDLREGLSFASTHNLRTQVLGGGSNVIFTDEGFDGLVLNIAIRGIQVVHEGEDALVTAAAGEPWDEFVRFCVERGYGGIECLSGIPGLVGATPIQNVGAYGQEVRETIVSLRALDTNALKQVAFSANECGFGYRQSRFKAADAGRYIIMDVTYRLRRQGQPLVGYPELERLMKGRTEIQRLEPGRVALEAVRTAVLALRKRKSMLIDPNDPHSRSVGSFFVNPVMTEKEFRSLVIRFHQSGSTDPIPSFPFEQRIKVPAAWLVEHAGYHRGFRKGGAGVSANHALALVNYGCTSRELLELATAIQTAVQNRFGVRLDYEPVVIH